MGMGFRFYTIMAGKTWQSYLTLRLGLILILREMLLMLGWLTYQKVRQKDRRYNKLLRNLGHFGVNLIISFIGLGNYWRKSWVSSAEVIVFIQESLQCPILLEIPAYIISQILLIYFGTDSSHIDLILFSGYLPLSILIPDSCEKDKFAPI